MSGSRAVGAGESPNTEARRRDSSSQRLTRALRIRRRQDFLRVQSEGVRVATRHFVFLMAPRPLDAPTRLGITVTRRIGCAVVRNRAKRLIRETFRQMPTALPQGVDLVVIVRRPLHGATTPDVVREWRGILPVLHRRMAALGAFPSDRRTV